MQKISLRVYNILLYLKHGKNYREKFVREVGEKAVYAPELNRANFQSELNLLVSQIKLLGICFNCPLFLRGVTPPGCFYELGTISELEH